MRKAISTGVVLACIIASLGVVGAADNNMPYATIPWIVSRLLVAVVIGLTAAKFGGMLK